MEEFSQGLVSLQLQGFPQPSLQLRQALDTLDALLIDLRVGQTSRGRVADVINLRHSQLLILRLLSQTLPGHHDRHRALCDQVIRERAENDAVNIR